MKYLHKTKIFKHYFCDLITDSAIKQTSILFNVSKEVIYLYYTSLASN